ncbi:MAG TPA: hypothetical protein VG406_14855 [Isosphaeraceae bacterium]|jgi:hypothetical protein|nr:hypothetical protein [Isosphaeraceae bacterium]
MSTLRVRHLWFGGWMAAFACLALLAASRALPRRAHAQDEDTGRRIPSAAVPSQVTICGIRATPGESKIDPRLRRKHLDPQLRRMFPGHGFRLLAVDSRPLIAGQSLTCDLEDGYAAKVELIDPFDKDGKVRLRIRLVRGKAIAFETVVTVPPNQLFFCDKALSDKTRLILGIAAR